MKPSAPPELHETPPIVAVSRAAPPPPVSSALCPVSDRMSCNPYDETTHPLGPFSSLGFFPTDWGESGTPSDASIPGNVSPVSLQSYHYFSQFRCVAGPPRFGGEIVSENRPSGCVISSRGWSKQEYNARPSSLLRPRQWLLPASGRTLL